MIYDMASKGMNTRQISELVGLSVPTVKAKLNASAIILEEDEEYHPIEDKLEMYEV